MGGLLIMIGLVVLGAIGSGTVIIFKKNEKAQKIAESVADVGKVALEQIRIALADDNKMDKEEVKDLFGALLEQIKKEIQESAGVT